MQIGVADAGRLDAHLDFPWTWFGDWHFLERKRFPEALNNSRPRHL
jgi:hypothetical protein